MATKKAESTMKTVGVKNTAVITDGCNPELVKGADFDGIFEIPIIKAPDIIAIPKAMVPFSKKDSVTPSNFAVCEYENDIEFADLLRNPDTYVKQFKKFQAVISPDASLYWDAPLAAQIVNKYRNHAIGYYLSSYDIHMNESDKIDMYYTVKKAREDCSEPENNLKAAVKREYIFL